VVGVSYRYVRLSLCLLFREVVVQRVRDDEKLLSKVPNKAMGDERSA
jgi:hypothetical protein